MNDNTILLSKSLDCHNMSDDVLGIFLNDVLSNSATMSDKMYLSVLGNILHCYFLRFTSKQKESLITSIINRGFKENCIGDRNELLGIMFKESPIKIRQRIVDSIINSLCKDMTESNVIANLNAVRTIYDSASRSQKKKIMASIIDMKDHIFDGPIMTSIEYTIDNISAL